MEICVGFVWQGFGTEGGATEAAPVNKSTSFLGLKAHLSVAKAEPINFSVITYLREEKPEGCGGERSRM